MGTATFTLQPNRATLAILLVLSAEIKILPNTSANYRRDKSRHPRASQGGGHLDESPVSYMEERN